MFSQRGTRRDLPAGVLSHDPLPALVSHFMMRLLSAVTHGVILLTARVSCSASLRQPHQPPTWSARGVWGCGDPISLLPEQSRPPGERRPGCGFLMPTWLHSPRISHMGTWLWASATLPLGAAGAQRVHSCTDAPKHQLSVTDKWHRTCARGRAICASGKFRVFFSGRWGRGSPRKVNHLFLVSWTRKTGLGMSACA